MQAQGYQIKGYLLCPEVYAVCSVMGQCVYRVNPGLTGRDSGVLTDRGALRLQGDPNMALVLSGTRLKAQHCQADPNTA